ncbi:MAG: DHH family phosphoesterase [Clostridia bacterium]|nr:DHH family phosphoesterase [Clostridia bacterium]
MNNKNKQKVYGKRAPLISLCIGVLALLCFLILLSQKIDHLLCFGISLAIIIIGNVIYTIYLRHKNKNGNEKLTHSLGQIMLEIVIKMQYPMVICDTTGKIIWRNRAFGQVTEKIGSVMGVGIGAISSINHEELTDGLPFSAELCERRYEIEPLLFKTDEKNYWFLVFDDCTEIDILNAKIESERSVVAYILIDNLDELSQHGQDSYRSEANDVSGILREFALSIGGILREYDRNKYILITNRDGLTHCRKTNFDILDRVRDIKVGDLGLPITISIGITDVGDTLLDREAGAREALTMALARGGDQVAYKSEGGMEFYGGNTRPVQKRSSVAAKVRSGEMVTRISRASNVIIMGHRGADQDCFGASAGIARLAMYCYVKPYIVVDKNDPNTKPFIEKFAKLPEYADVFVDENEAQSLIGTDTLLIVVDVNNIDHMLSSGIALAVNDALIIDHHRKTDSRTKRDWLAQYIEPSASSASELVAEILEQSIGEGQILKEEADALLGGIILDTKQFTKSTGTRTFNAAIYLRNAGASIYESSKELKSEFGEFQKQSKILSDLVIYKGRFAIAKDEVEGVPTDRIAAAKAAETLLGIKGVDAAFALIRIGGETHISARSNASVSVQLILEKMGGGGHLDSAGAKSGDPMLAALEKLKVSIDEYLEENDKSKK